MRKTRILSLLVVLCILTSATAWAQTFSFGAAAPKTEKTFRVGQALELFERDGVALSLTGDIVMMNADDSFATLADVRDTNASVGLPVVVENASAKALFIEYEGKVNGTQLGSGTHPLVNIHKVEPGDKVPAYIVLNPSWLNNGTVLPLQSCELTFHVFEKPTERDSDNVRMYKETVGTIWFNRVPTGGKVFRTGEKLTVVNENNITIDLSVFRVSKGSTYLLIGGTVNNQSGQAITVTQQTRVNGWSVGGYWNGVLNMEGQSLNFIPNGQQMSVIFPAMLSNTWVKIHSEAELESVEMTFSISTVDKTGSTAGWFRASTGTIWINREIHPEATPEETPKATPEKTVVKTAEPTEGPQPTTEPEQAKLPALMSGLEFGDTKATVKGKLSADGAGVYEENGSLHGVSDLYAFRNKEYDFLFSDQGKLNCVRNMCIMDEEVSSKQAEEMYQKVLAQLIDTYGAPNGRGPTEKRISANKQMTNIMASITPGVYCNSVHHDEWYIKTDKYPIKIDLIYENTGNTTANSHGIVVELDIEAVGI